MARKLTQYTKEQIGEVLDMWETKTVEEIAETMGLRRAQVQYIANGIREVLVEKGLIQLPKVTVGYGRPRVRA